MTLNKIALCSLILFFSCNNVQAHEKTFFSKSNQPSKDFAVGVLIGVTHGTINREFESNWSGDRNRNIALNSVTLGAASYAESSYNNDGKVNLITLWGRGIGQCLAESSQTKGFSLTLNIPLLAAGFLSIIHAYRNIIKTEDK
ncbi:hypothetical protein HYX58_01930 [Candidatus Dependentiae bacterium]|nr:hypothetical protein [Candidatus Dependentiae bacterium]